MANSGCNPLVLGSTPNSVSNNEEGEAVLKGLPWFIRLDDWLHKHVPKKAYPLWGWYCDWTDRRITGGFDDMQ